MCIKPAAYPYTAHKISQTSKVYIAKRHINRMVEESEVKHISLWSAMLQQAIFWFKPNLKTKGAILILVWNFLLINVYNYPAVYTNRPNGHAIETIALSFTLPLAGWLADVHFGRYKVIRWSMWIMWVGSMLATVSSIVVQLADHSYSKVFELLTVVFFSIATIGFGGYAGNIIQFGMDQLQDASTTEITAFLSWFVWTYFSSYIVLQFQFVHACTNEEYHILGQLQVCTGITVVIASTFMLDTALIKEPVTQNPFIRCLGMLLKQSIQDRGVPSPTGKRSFLLVLTSEKVNMGDHSQQSRWKMSKHF